MPRAGADAGHLTANPHMAQNSPSIRVYIATRKLVTVNSGCFSPLARVRRSIHSAVSFRSLSGVGLSPSLERAATKARECNHEHPHSWQRRREHVLAWAVLQNLTAQLIVAPGNAGIAAHSQTAPLSTSTTAPAWSVLSDENTLISSLSARKPLLAAGWVGDASAVQGRAGPLDRRKAAANAGSLHKPSQRDLRRGKPASRAPMGHFTDAALRRGRYLADAPCPIVIKGDGLQRQRRHHRRNDDEALAESNTMFDGTFGDAGAEVVIEESLTRRSAFSACWRGRLTGAAIGTAQDHKRVGDGRYWAEHRRYGCLLPDPVFDDEIADARSTEIIRPTMAEMATAWTPYQGVLYAGLMIKDGCSRDLVEI